MAWALAGTVHRRSCWARGTTPPPWTFGPPDVSSQRWPWAHRCSSTTTKSASSSKSSSAFKFFLAPRPSLNLSRKSPRPHTRTALSKTGVDDSSPSSSPINALLQLVGLSTPSLTALLISSGIDHHGSGVAPCCPARAARELTVTLLARRVCCAGGMQDPWHAQQRLMARGGDAARLPGYLSAVATIRHARQDGQSSRAGRNRPTHGTHTRPAPSRDRTGLAGTCPHAQFGVAPHPWGATS